MTPFSVAAVIGSQARVLMCSEDAAGGNRLPLGPDLTLVPQVTHLARALSTGQAKWGPITRGMGCATHGRSFVDR